MKAALALLLILSLAGCGRQWEHFWGQDTRPETRYIPLTPDQFERPLGPVYPFQWADARFTKARYLNVFACRSDNVCVDLPKESEDELDFAVWILDYGTAILTVYNAEKLRIGGVAPSKIRFQVVL